MKTILILVDKIDPRHIAVTKFLAENVNKGTEAVLGLFTDIVFNVKKGQVECKCGELNMSEVELVYFRRAGKKYIQLAGTIALFLAKRNIRFIDRAFVNLGAAGNKLYNIVKLAQENIPVAPSVFVSRKNLLNLAETLAKKFGYPIFTKSLTKQRREGIFVVEEKSDFRKLLKDDGSEGFLIQPKVKIDKEYRVVVMGESVAAVHEEGERKIKNKRIIVDSEESSLGWVSPETLSKEIGNAVIKGSKILKLNISGADVGIEKATGKFYIFEINRGPGFTIDPNVSPELPQLAKYFDKLLSEKL